MTELQSTGAELLLQILREEAVAHIFGNPGTTEMPLIEAISRAEGFHYVLGLQEVAVVGMADGYARATRRPAFVNLHTAGGVGHAIGGIVNAKLARIPLVITAGQQDRRHLAQHPVLSGPLADMARPVSKSALEVTRIEDLPYLLRRAFAEAMAPPMGPVFLSLPMDLLHDGAGGVKIPPRAAIFHGAPEPMIGALAARLAKIAPGTLALIAGDEAAEPAAADALVKLAELLAAPVFGTGWSAINPMPTLHPLWQGNLPLTNQAIQDKLAAYHTVFAIAAEPFQTIPYSAVEPLAAETEFFHLASHAGDLGRFHPPQFGIVGEIGASLEALVAALKGKINPAVQPSYPITAQPATIQSSSQTQSQLTPIPIAAACEALCRALPDDTLMVTELPSGLAILPRYYRSTRAGRYHFGGSSALGWAMPGAVGMALALGGEPVVCVVGVGGALYAPHALWSAVHEKLPVVFVVFNNAQYRILYDAVRIQSGAAAANRKLVGLDITEPKIDYLALAASFGMRAEQATTAAALSDRVRAAYEAARDRHEAALIDVTIVN